MANNKMNNKQSLSFSIPNEFYFEYEIETQMLRIFINNFMKKKYKLIDFVSKFIYFKDRISFLDFFMKSSTSIKKFRIIEESLSWYEIRFSFISESYLKGYMFTIDKQDGTEIEKDKLKFLSQIQEYMLSLISNRENTCIFDKLALLFEAEQVFVAKYLSKLTIKYTSALKNTCSITQKELLFLEQTYLKKSFVPKKYSDIKEIPQVSSFISFPICDNEKNILGFLGVVNAKNTFILKNDINFLNDAISHGIENLFLYQELEFRESFDALTGVKNRNAYESYLKTKNKDLKTLGLIVVDINGLKHHNDTSGHKAGDELIQKVAKSLSCVFQPENVYRFGGDEFVVICENIEEENLKQKINSFYTCLDNTHVSLGYVFQSQDINIPKMQEEADQLMYRDKKQFYINNPMLKQRKY